jgi:hypothetical protein
MVDTFTEQDVRKQTWERDIKGFAKKKYVMKELVMEVSSDAWTNSYYQKTATSLTGGTSSAVKGIPRGAEFPFMEKGVTLVSSIILKHGGEGVIYWEDILTSNIAVETETILDITDAVVNSVDGTIYSTLSQNDTPSTINTVAIAAGYEWDSLTIANRDPVQNILDAIAQISIDRYPILTSGRGYLVVNEQDYANILGNTKVLNNPTFHLADGILSNGNLGRLCGLNIKVSPVVTADKALICLAKTCATWKQTMPLTVEVIKDPLKKYTIRAAEIGVCQLTDPEAVCLITNTRR